MPKQPPHDAPKHDTPMARRAPNFKEQDYSVQNNLQSALHRVVETATRHVPDSVKQGAVAPPMESVSTPLSPSPYADLWAGVQALMIDHMSTSSFQTWIRPLHIDNVELASDDEASITLMATSDFNRGYIKNNYGKALADAFKALLGVQKIVLHWAVGEGGATAPPAERPSFSQAQDIAETLSKQQEVLADPQSNRPWTPRTLTSGLQPRYTFEQYVVGGFNHFAHAAAVAIAEQPGIAYNPFFVHGSVGLGKTHLVQAIGHYALRHHPNLVVKYVTTETFTNDLIHSIATKKMDAFRDKYRKIDLLIIDDIQFLEGKDKTQEEVFHTFNALHGLSKQIILTSDRPPKALARLEERLISRFEWGLIVDVQVPNLDARKAILAKKAEREGLTLRFHLDDDVITHMAEQSSNNIRELEGNFNKLIATCMLEDAPFSMTTVEKLFGLPEQTQRMSEEGILDIVSQTMGISVKDLKGIGRNKETAHARQVATYVCRELMESSFPKLGRLFNRKHSTMLYGYEKLKEQVAQNIMLKKQVDDIMQKCRNQCY